MDLMRALHVLYGRKWLILLSIIVTTGLTYGATRLIGSKWEATVRLSTPRWSPFSDLSGKTGLDTSLPQYGPTAREAANSQAALFEETVKSREVLEPSLAKVGMTQLDPDLLSRITVTAVNPAIYLLQVTDANQAKAKDLANALADNFKVALTAQTAAEKDKLVKFLQEKVDDASTELARARENLENYRKQQGYVGSATSFGGTNSIELALSRYQGAIQRRDDAKQRLADLEAQIAAKERQISSMPAMVASSVTEGPGPTVRALQEALAKAEVDLAGLRAHYSDSYPAVRSAIAARDALDNQLKGVTKAMADRAKQPGTDAMVPNPELPPLRSEVATLRQQADGLRAQQTEAETTLRLARNEIDQFRGVDSRLAQLATDVAQRSDDRSKLLERLNAARIAVDATDGQSPVTIARYVDSANPPQNTTQGRTLKLIAMAAICALLLTSGLAIALDSLDQRVRNVHQAEVALPAKVLAAIPQPMGAVTYTGLARATELQPQSLHSESFRFLGLHLLSPNGPKVRSLMVLSAKAEQGSTTTLTNLAITLAQAGKRVIAVDANTRTAELHQVFGISNEYGFTDLLKNCENGSLERAIRPTSVDNLQVITSGPTPPNAWELFHSHNLVQLSQRLHERADYVLYDTPSALLFTDALNLATVVEAAFLVVRADEPLTGAEQRLVDLLEQNDVRVLGSVLSGVPVSVVEGYHNYQHYYGRISTPALQAPAIAAGQEAEAQEYAVTAGPVIDVPKKDE